MPGVHPCREKAGSFLHPVVQTFIKGLLPARRPGWDRAKDKAGLVNRKVPGARVHR